MKKLEDYVTSFEISKKFKELGVKQESCLYWGEYEGGNTLIEQCELETCKFFDSHPGMEVNRSYYSAFFMNDVLEMLYGHGNFSIPLRPHSSYFNTNYYGEQIITFIENQVMSKAWRKRWLNDCTP